jgi:DNA-binding ferritin-like protein
MGLFPDSMLEGGQQLSLEVIASRLTYFQNQVKLLHWQTTVYAEHIALGSLYDKLSDFTDEIVEKIIGYSNNVRPKAFKIDPLKESVTSEQVVRNIVLFAHQLEEYAEANDMPDICNISQALSGDASQTLYLLSLS